MPELSEPRLDPNIPEYPTEDQMDTMFNAYKTGGKAALVAALEAARQKREADKTLEKPTLLNSSEQQKASTLTRNAETDVKSAPTPEEPMYPASVVRILVDQANSLVERNDQLEGEKRSGFWYQMNESLHNPGDRVAWFMVLFIFSIALTFPFLPGGAAFIVSAMIAALPAALIDHKKR